MMRTNLEHAVEVQLDLHRPHLSPAARAELTRRLLDLPAELQENLAQWAKGYPLSPVPVRDKYTVEDVLSIRRDGDMVSALLDLGAYAWDEAEEYRLWLVRV